MLENGKAENQLIRGAIADGTLSVVYGFFLENVIVRCIWNNWIYLSTNSD